jgi:hypothetical protein
MTPTSDWRVLALEMLALGCWLMMFLSGHDIWHDSGRPDVRQMGATAFDVQTFVCGFYALPVVLLVLIGVTEFAAARRSA